MIIRLALAVCALILTPACSKKKFNGSTPRTTAFKQVDEKNIQFGDGNVFRIGDGTAGGNSSCADELMGYDLRGSKYYFQFQVLEDDTSVDLAIGKICGVDRDGATVISVMSETGVEVPERVVPVDGSPNRSFVWQPFPTFNLDKGTYSVVVAAKNTLGRTGPVAAGVDEYDDFIIGSIQVKGQKKVKAVRVYAE